MHLNSDMHFGSLRKAIKKEVEDEIMSGAQVQQQQAMPSRLPAQFAPPGQRQLAELPGHGLPVQDGMP